MFIAINVVVLREGSVAEEGRLWGLPSTWRFRVAWLVSLVVATELIGVVLNADHHVWVRGAAVAAFVILLALARFLTGPVRHGGLEEVREDREASDGTSYR